MAEINALLERIAVLSRNAKRGKDKHFHAAERKGRYHIIIGILLIVINALLASKLIEEDKYISAIALVGVLLGSVQTFFNYQKTVEGHRSIGNRYTSISTKADGLLARIRSGLVGADSITTVFDDLEQDYLQINVDSEAFPTSQSDYNAAISRERTLQKSEAYDSQTPAAV